MTLTAHTAMPIRSSSIPSHSEMVEEEEEEGEEGRAKILIHLLHEPKVQNYSHFQSFWYIGRLAKAIKHWVERNTPQVLLYSKMRQGKLSKTSNKKRCNNNPHAPMSLTIDPKTEVANPHNCMERVG